jgi:hypothetical protein
MHTFWPCHLSRPQGHLPVLVAILATQIQYLNDHAYSSSSESTRLRDVDHHVESLLPFPVWETGNVSPFFPTSHFYPILLNSFPNKFYYYFYYFSHLAWILLLSASTKIYNSTKLSRNIHHYHVLLFSTIQNAILQLFNPFPSPWWPLIFLLSL